MEWTKTLLTTFIEMYRDRPCLWHVKSECYKSKRLKNAAYEELAAYLRCNGFPEADSKFVKAKIQNLRRAVRKEMHKIEASLKSGANADEVYIPSLWYYELMSFTKDQDVLLTSVNSLSPSSQNDDPIEFEDMDEGDELQYYPQTQLQEPLGHVESSDQQMFNGLQHMQFGRKKPKIEDALPAFMRSCTAALAAHERVDEFSAFGIHVAAKIKKMKPTQQIYAELLIQRVIAKGLLEQLNEMTDVVES